MRNFLQILFFYALITQIHFPQLTSQFSGNTVSISDMQFVPAADTLGPELIINGDMELNTYWVPAFSPESSVQSTDFAHGGSYSWKTVTSSGSGTASSYTPPQLEVIEDSTYWVDAYVYIASGSAQITIFTDDYDQMWSSTVTNEWLHVSFSFVAADLVEPGRAYIYFLGNSDGTSTFYIDAVSIKQRITPALIPVELTSFSATILDKDVCLQWTTATETNNSGYSVERIIKTEKNWNTISFVNGVGTTTELTHYSYTDKNVPAGIYGYRLKQIDFDGSSEYSNIIEVDVNLPKEFVLEQNYPNPFNPSTKIRYTIPSNINYQILKVVLKIYDILGHEVATLINEEKTAGVYELKFDASNLNSGIYFYKIEAGSFVQTKKMILMK